MAIESIVFRPGLLVAHLHQRHCRQQVTQRKDQPSSSGAPTPPVENDSTDDRPNQRR